MAPRSFAPSLALILAHEGGYVDHPLDPGGATNRGVTRATLAAHRGRPVTKAEVRALGEAEAGAIYRARYWDVVRADELPAGLDLVVFDAAVNSGPSRAVKWLQAELGLEATGVMDEPLLKAARLVPARALIGRYTARRLGFLRRLSTWSAFGRGWTRRVLKTETRALGLTGPAAPATSPPQQKKDAAMIETKNLVASRTLWSNLIGLGAIGLSLFGVDSSSIDNEALSQAMLQAVAGVSFIASTVFRLTATRRLAL